MGRSNLIPITKIYDIYQKYTFSKDVKRFMHEIVDIPMEKVFTKDEVIAMLNELADEISSLTMDNDPLDIADYIREKINALKGD